MSRSRRVWQVLATMVVVSLIAAGCGDDDDDGEAATGGDGEGSIWVLLPDTASSDRWEKDDRRFFAEAFEAAGLSEGEDFTIVNAEGDANTQQSQAEQAIADGASVIVLTSLDTGSGATIIDQARESDVQVVEYDRFNTGGSGGDAYVSFDNVQVGAAMAAWELDLYLTHLFVAAYLAGQHDQGVHSQSVSADQAVGKCRGAGVHDAVVAVQHNPG